MRQRRKEEMITKVDNMIKMRRLKRHVTWRRPENERSLTNSNRYLRMSERKVLEKMFDKRKITMTREEHGCITT